MVRKALSTLAVALPLAAAPFITANATPQVLAVVASLSPTTLICANGECSAEFTSFCLTEHLASPARGTPYTAHDTQPIKVTGLRTDGSRVDLPVQHAISFESARNHLAVKFSLPQIVLRQYDVASVSVAIDDGLSLVPVKTRESHWALTDADIALAAGPLRAAATQIVDRGGERVDAARITSLVINALPENGRAPEVARQTAWNQAAPGTASFGDSAIAMAREVHDSCQAATKVGFGTMRQCLSSAHDIFMGKLNKKYWDAVKTGS